MALRNAKTALAASAMVLLASGGAAAQSSDDPLLQGVPMCGEGLAAKRAGISLAPPTAPQTPAPLSATGDVGGVEITADGGITVIALNSGMHATQRAAVRVDMTVAPSAPARR